MYRFFAALLVLTVFCLPAQAQETDSTKAPNPFETLFRGLQKAQTDEASTEKAKTGLGNVMKMLGTLADSSEAARTRVQGMERGVSPDSVNTIIGRAMERVNTVTRELQAEEFTLYATKTTAPSPERAGPAARVGPMRIVASLLDRGNPNGRGVVDASVNAAGELYLTGGYTRHAVLADTPVRTSDAALTTDDVDMPVRSSVQAHWLREGRSGLGSSVGMAIEALDDGAYVLGYSQGGPTQVGSRTIEHGKYEKLAYLTRLDDSGEPTWIAALARPGYDLNDGTMAAASDGRVYVGYALYSMRGVRVATEQDLSAGTATFGASYTNHQMLAAYAPDGTRLWQQVAENVTVTALETGPDGSLYAAGHFTASSDFCGGIATDRDQAAFIARLTSDGTCDWIQTTTGSMGDREADADDPKHSPGGINSFRAVAATGTAVFVTGSFLKATDFGGRALSDGRTSTSALGVTTGLVARLDARTGSVRWVKARRVPPPDIATFSSDNTGHAYGDAVAVDGRGGVYLVESRATLEQDENDEQVLAHDLRVVKMRGDGRVAWEESTGVSAFHQDYFDHRPMGVSLVEAPSGPPYLLVQDPAFSMPGVQVPADEGVRHVALGRLGGGGR